MGTLTVIAYALILYGVFTLYIAWAKPKAIWNIGKILWLALLGTPFLPSFVTPLAE